MVCGGRCWLFFLFLYIFLLPFSCYLFSFPLFFCSSPFVLWLWRCCWWWDWWWLKVLVERERKKKRSWEKDAFLSNLDPISSPFRLWKSNIFIDDGRGRLFLLWCQILALGSTRKHPNRWFKVAMKNCQFCAGKWLVELATLGGATASQASINPNGLH